MPISPVVSGTVCGLVGVLLGTKLTGTNVVHPNITVVVGGCDEKGPSQRVYVGNERTAKREEEINSVSGPLVWLLSVVLTGVISYGVGRCWSALEPRGAQPVGQVQRRALAPPAPHIGGVIGW